MSDRMALSALTDHVERTVYYVILVSYFVVTLLSEFDVFSWTWLDTVGTVLFPAVLLSIFRYFDGISRFKPAVQTHSELGTAIGAVLADQVRVEHLRILACTSSKYFVLLKDKGGRVGTLRLLLPSDAALTSCVFLSPDTRATLIEEKARTLQNWNALLRAGQVERLEVLELPVVPQLHMMINGHTSAVLGLFERLPNGTGMQTIGKFVAKHSDPLGAQLVADCLRYFNAWYDGAPPLQSFDFREGWAERGGALGSAPLDGGSESLKAVAIKQLKDAT